MKKVQLNEKLSTINQDKIKVCPHFICHILYPLHTIFFEKGGQTLYENIKRVRPCFLRKKTFLSYYCILHFFYFQYTKN